MSITDKTPVKLPLVLWLSALLAASMAGGAYYSIKADVTQHSSDITELKTDARMQREILIRVDENVKELKRRVP